jgi:hypothetical protein
MAKAEEQVVDQAVEGATDAQAPESISLMDLQTLLQIVDLASQRGAFRGAELTQVGAIFDKLSTFLSFVAEQQAAQAEAQAGEEAPAEE